MKGKNQCISKKNKKSTKVTSVSAYIIMYVNLERTVNPERTNYNTIQVTYITEFWKNALNQGCANCDPRAKSGPRPEIVRPAKGFGS